MSDEGDGERCAGDKGGIELNVEWLEHKQAENA